MRRGSLKVGKAKIGDVVVVEEGDLEGLMRVPFHTVGMLAVFFRLSDFRVLSFESFCEVVVLKRKC
jgi:hypothetical protein